MSDIDEIIKAFAQQLSFPGSEFESKHLGKPEDYSGFGQSQTERELSGKRYHSEEKAQKPLPFPLNFVDYNHWEDPKTEDKKFTFPSPGYFPKTDTDQINYIANKGWYNEEQANNIYNSFRRYYAKFYDAYLDSLRLMDSVSSPEIYWREIEGKGMKEAFPKIVDFLISSITHGIGKSFIKTKIWNAEVLRPEKKLDVGKLGRVRDEMQRCMKIYENGQKVLQYLDKRVRKDMDNYLSDPEATKKLEFLDKYPKETRRIFDSIRRMGYELEYVRNGTYVMNAVEALKTIKDFINRVTTPLKKNIEQAPGNVAHIATENFKTLVDDKTRIIMDGIFDKLKNLDDNISNPYLTPDNAEVINKINNAYNEIVSAMIPHLDLKPFERMISNKRFSKDPITKDGGLLAFKYAVIENYREAFDINRGYHHNKLQDLHRNYNDQINKLVQQKNVSQKVLDKSLEVFSDKLALDEVKFVLNRIFTSLNTYDTYIDDILTKEGIKGAAYSAHNYVGEFGDFSPQALFKKFRDEKSFSFIPPNVINKFLQIALDEENYSELGNYLTNSRAKKIFILSAKALEKLNKLTPENLYNTVKNSYKFFRDTIDALETVLPSPTDVPEILLKGIKSYDTLTRDLEATETIANTVHNYANKMPKGQFLKLLENKNAQHLGSRDITKKLYEAVVKILSFGSFEAFKKTNAENIKLAEEKDLIKKGFIKRAEFIVKLFNSNKEINPSHPEFAKLKEIILQTKSEIATVLQFEKFKEQYAKAKDVKKNDMLFKLDFQVSDNLRFRVLRDLDPQHFSVGNETDCCQSPGGAGEQAMIDSFINPLAGVVILEYKEDEGWQTVAQSYFHYVPRDRSYILDNIEVAPKYKNSSLNIEAIYAYWAQKMKEQNPDIKYFQAGKRYSDVDTNKFKSQVLKHDPRSFSTDRPYTDWKADEGNINLLKPIKEITKTPLVTESIYNIAETFYKLAAGIQ